MSITDWSAAWRQRFGYPVSGSTVRRTAAVSVIITEGVAVGTEAVGFAGI